MRLEVVVHQIATGKRLAQQARQILRRSCRCAGRHIRRLKVILRPDPDRVGSHRATLIIESGGSVRTVSAVHGSPVGALVQAWNHSAVASRTPDHPDHDERRAA